MDFVKAVATPQIIVTSASFLKFLMQPLKLLYLVELVDDYGLFTSAPPQFFSMASRCTRGGGNTKV